MTGSAPLFGEPADFCLLVGLGLTLLGAAALWRLIRLGALLSAAGGLHLNMFLFFGLGTVAYVLAPPAERGKDIVGAMAGATWPLALGYGMAVGWLYWSRRRQQDLRDHVDRGVASIKPRTTFAFLALALVGYLGSLAEISASGLGTIFPVLKMYWYPVAALGVASASRRDAASLLLLLLAMAIPGYFSLLSGWRSELITFAGSLTLGLALRSRRWAVLSPLLVASLVLLVLPFAHQKKVDYERVSADPVRALADTLTMSLQDRLLFTAEFWATRVSGARELGYVEYATTAGHLPLRGGDSYVEALEQLVPRILWPSKPSFNLSTNYYLARTLGLLDWSDESSSWGINLYAEAAWNFGAVHLVWFVPLVFLLSSSLDRQFTRRIRTTGVAWLARAALFFYAMAIVGLVNAMTFLLWLFIVSKVADVLVRARATHLGAPRPDGIRA